MKIPYYLLLLLLIPVLTIVVTNELSPAPTTTYQEGKCTRYCHNKACLHTEENRLTNGLSSIYQGNIHWLKYNPVGIDYEEMNIVVYVLLYPLLVIVLLWGLIRKRHG